MDNPYLSLSDEELSRREAELENEISSLGGSVTPNFNAMSDAALARREAELEGQIAATENRLGQLQDTLSRMNATPASERQQPQEQAMPGTGIAPERMADKNFVGNDNVFDENGELGFLGRLRAGREAETGVNLQTSSDNSFVNGLLEVVSAFAPFASDMLSAQEGERRLALTDALKTGNIDTTWTDFGATTRALNRIAEAWDEDEGAKYDLYKRNVEGNALNEELESIAKQEMGEDGRMRAVRDANGKFVLDEKYAGPKDEARKMAIRRQALGMLNLDATTKELAKRQLEADEAAWYKRGLASAVQNAGYQTGFTAGRVIADASGLTRRMEALGKGAAGKLGKNAAWLLAPVVSNAVGRYYQLRADDVYFDDAGNLQIEGNGLGVGKALGKGLAGSLAENITEVALGDVADKLIGKPGKWIFNKIPGAKAIFGKAASSAPNWMKRTGLGILEGYGRMQNYTHLDGFPGEIFEEYVQGAFDNVLGLDKKDPRERQALGQFSKEFFNWDKNFKDLAVGMLFTMAGQAALGLGAGRIRNQMNSTSREVRGVLKAHGWSDEDIANSSYKQRLFTAMSLSPELGYNMQYNAEQLARLGGMSENDIKKFTKNGDLQYAVYALSDAMNTGYGDEAKAEAGERATVRPTPVTDEEGNMFVGKNGKIITENKTVETKGLDEIREFMTHFSQAIQDMVNFTNERLGLDSWRGLTQADLDEYGDVSGFSGKEKDGVFWFSGENGNKEAVDNATGTKIVDVGGNGEMYTVSNPKLNTDYVAYSWESARKWADRAAKLAQAKEARRSWKQNFVDDMVKRIVPLDKGGKTPSVRYYNAVRDILNDSSLPMALRRQAMREGANAGGQAVTLPDGSVAVFLDNIQTPGEAAVSIVHEIAGHGALDAFFRGKENSAEEKAALNKRRRAASEETLGEGVVEQVKKNYADSALDEELNVRAHEGIGGNAVSGLGRTATAPVSQTRYQRLTGRLRQFLAKHTGMQFDLTPDEWDAVVIEGLERMAQDEDFPRPPTSARNAGTNARKTAISEIDGGEKMMSGLRTAQRKATMLLGYTPGLSDKDKEKLDKLLDAKKKWQGTEDFENAVAKYRDLVRKYRTAQAANKNTPKGEEKPYSKEQMKEMRDAISAQWKVLQAFGESEAVQKRVAEKQKTKADEDSGLGELFEAAGNIEAEAEAEEEEAEAETPKEPEKPEKPADNRAVEALKSFLDDNGVRQATETLREFAPQVLAVKSFDELIKIYADSLASQAKNRDAWARMTKSWGVGRYAETDAEKSLQRKVNGGKAVNWYIKQMLVYGFPEEAAAFDNLPIAEQLRRMGLDIDVKETGGRIVVTGDTYPLRDILKDNGFKWDPAASAWTMDAPEVKEPPKEPPKETLKAETPAKTPVEASRSAPAEKATTTPPESTESVEGRKSADTGAIQDEAEEDNGRSEAQRRADEQKKTDSAAAPVLKNVLDAARAAAKFIEGGIEAPVGVLNNLKFALRELKKHPMAHWDLPVGDGRKLMLDDISDVNKAAKVLAEAIAGEGNTPSDAVTARFAELIESEIGKRVLRDHDLAVIPKEARESKAKKEKSAEEQAQAEADEEARNNLVSAIRDAVGSGDMSALKTALVPFKEDPLLSWDFGAELNLDRFGKNKNKARWNKTPESIVNLQGSFVLSHGVITDFVTNVAGEGANEENIKAVVAVIRDTLAGAPALKHAEAVRDGVVRGKERVNVYKREQAYRVEDMNAAAGFLHKHFGLSHAEATDVWGRAKEIGRLFDAVYPFSGDSGALHMPWPTDKAEGTEWSELWFNWSEITGFNDPLYALWLTGGRESDYSDVDTGDVSAKFSTWIATDELHPEDDIVQGVVEYIDAQRTRFNNIVGEWNSLPETLRNEVRKSGFRGKAMQRAMYRLNRMQNELYDKAEAALIEYNKTGNLAQAEKAYQELAGFYEAMNDAGREVTSILGNAIYEHKGMDQYIADSIALREAFLAAHPNSDPFAADITSEDIEEAREFIGDEAADRLQREKDFAEMDWTMADVALEDDGSPLPFRKAGRGAVDGLRGDVDWLIGGGDRASGVFNRWRLGSAGTFDAAVDEFGKKKIGKAPKFSRKATETPLDYTVRRLADVGDLLDRYNKAGAANKGSLWAQIRPLAAALERDIRNGDIPVDIIRRKWDDLPSAARVAAICALSEEQLKRVMPMNDPRIAKFGGNRYWESEESLTEAERKLRMYALDASRRAEARTEDEIEADEEGLLADTPDTDAEDGSETDEEAEGAEWLDRRRRAVRRAKRAETALADEALEADLDAATKALAAYSGMGVRNIFSNTDMPDGELFKIANDLKQRDGDRMDAMAELFRRNYPYVLGQMFRKMRGSADAKDAAMEGMLKALGFKSRMEEVTDPKTGEKRRELVRRWTPSNAEFKGENSFRSYALKTAQNVWLEELRQLGQKRVGESVVAKPRTILPEGEDGKLPDWLENLEAGKVLGEDGTVQWKQRTAEEWEAQREIDALMRHGGLQYKRWKATQSLERRALLNMVEREASIAEIAAALRITESAAKTRVAETRKALREALSNPFAGTLFGATSVGARAYDDVLASLSPQQRQVWNAYRAANGDLGAVRDSLRRDWEMLARGDRGEGRRLLREWAEREAADVTPLDVLRERDVANLRARGVSEAVAAKMADRWMENRRELRKTRAERERAIQGDLFAALAPADASAKDAPWNLSNEHIRELVSRTEDALAIAGLNPDGSLRKPKAQAKVPMMAQEQLTPEAAREASGVPMMARREPAKEVPKAAPAPAPSIPGLKRRERAVQGDLFDMKWRKGDSMLDNFTRLASIKGPAEMRWRKILGELKDNGAFLGNMTDHMEHLEDSTFPDGEKRKVGAESIVRRVGDNVVKYRDAKDFTPADMDKIRWHNDLFGDKTPYDVRGIVLDNEWSGDYRPARIVLEQPYVEIREGGGAEARRLLIEDLRRRYGANNVKVKGDPSSEGMEIDAGPYHIADLKDLNIGIDDRTGDYAVWDANIERREAGMKWRIPGIYTGTSADYANRSRQGGVDDGPSLKKIGSGNGSMAFGWGLYGSTSRDVADWYSEVPRDLWVNFVKYDGKPVPRASIGKPYWHEMENAAIRIVDANGDIDAAIDMLTADGDVKAAEFLEKNRGSYSFDAPRKNIYEQTWFTNREPGDESHLLGWYEPVSKENAKRIADAIRKEFPGNSLAERTANRIESGKMIGKEVYMSMRDLFDKAGDMVKDPSLYEGKGNYQRASEFLYRADIDGIKHPTDLHGNAPMRDGDKAGWNYVSFRDDNIRVDHKWRDGEMLWRKSAPFSAEADSAGMTEDERRTIEEMRRDPKFSYSGYMAERAHDRTGELARGEAKLANATSFLEKAKLFFTDRDVNQFVRDRIREGLQDQHIHLRRMEERMFGGLDKIDKGADLYYFRDANIGKAGDLEMQFDRELITPLHDEIKKLGEGGMDRLNLVLNALHAPERNRMIAERTDGKTLDGSGMTTAFAKAVLDKAAADGFLKAEFDPKSKTYRVTGGKAAKAVGLVRRIIDNTRQLQVQSGRKSAADAKNEAKLSPNYVPLRTDMGDVLKEFAHAFGRQSLADSPVAYSELLLKTAMSGYYDNVERRRLAQLVQRFPGYGMVFNTAAGDILTETQVERFKKFLDYMKEHGGAMTERMAEELEPLGIASQKELEARLAASGEGLPVRKSLVNGKVRESVDTAALDRKYPDIVSYMRDGQVWFVRLGGEKLSKAEAARIGEEVKKSGMLRLNLALKTIRKATSWFSQLRTSYSPEFFVSNVLADNRQAVQNLMSTFGAKSAAQFEKYIVGGGNAANAAAASAARYLKGKLDPAKYPIDKYTQEWAKGGGRIGGMSFSNFKDVDDGIRKLVRDYEQAARGDKRLMALGKKIKQGIEDLNAATEMGTRIAAYATCRENGYSIPDAVSYSRDITVNFDRRGNWTPVLNSLYAFSNASIQDVHRTLVAIGGPADWAKKGGKRGLAVLAGMALLGFLRAALGYGQDDPEEAVAGLPQYEYTSEYEKQDMFGLRIGKANYAIPIRGLARLPYYAGQKVYEVLADKTSAADAAKDLGSFVAQNVVDPIGNSDNLLQTVAPSIIRPAVEYAQNTNFAGNQIFRQPRSSKDVKSEMGYRNTQGVFKWAARALNELTGGSASRSGMIDMQPEKIQHIYSAIFGSLGADLLRAGNFVYDLANGEDVLAVENARNIPFLRRVRRDLAANSRTFRDAKDRYEADLQDWNANEGNSAVRAEIAASAPYLADERWAQELKDLSNAAQKLMTEENKAEGDERKAAQELRMRVQALFIRRLKEPPRQVSFAREQKRAQKDAALFLKKRKESQKRTERRGRIPMMP